MENRILIIADELFGENGEAAERFSELLLCSEPERPLQFVLNAPLPYSLRELLQKVAPDVIGKQADRIFLGLGLRELRRGADVEELAATLAELLKDVLLKTNSRIFLVTVPGAAFAEVPSAVERWNEVLRNAAGERVCVLDFAAHVAEFRERQLSRGKFARSLFDGSGVPTPICCMLLSLYLQKMFYQTREVT